MEILIIVWLFGITLFLVYLAVKSTKNQTGSLEKSLILLQNEVQSLANLVTRHLGDFSQKVDTGLMTTSNALVDVKQSLGRLEEVTRSVEELTKDIAQLQTILQPQATRGVIGEVFLQKLVQEVMPKNSFKFQYSYPRSNVKVDVALFVNGKVVPIDAKFPLDNFRKFLNESDLNSKTRYRRMFFEDVKRRIDEVASKYIRPDEGTFNFAMLYIPAEGVYYEAFLNQDRGELYNYALSKRVIPVSPSTFYAYLQIILYGLKGLELERRAEQILDELSGLSRQLEYLMKALSVLGEHIKRASNKFEEVRRALEYTQSRVSKLAVLGSRTAEFQRPR